ncbi:MAG: hypothetical protein HY299_18705 [Verrucomicrobia bacterium]|nr:hypothetical protein [Verrucomicrobiota bacterium]
MNWNQFTTLLWLRWRLSRNQLRRGHTVNAVLSAIALVFGAVGILGAVVGGFFAGLHLMKLATPEGLLMGLDIFTGAFLFMWTLGALHELQRSEAIDFQRLMHLPISLPQLFFMNYVASLATPVLLLMIPASISLTLGWAVAQGPSRLALIPLQLGFFFLITAWTYYLRGWLVSLMVNQRRRRAILTTLTVVIILAAQAPNLYFNLFRQGANRRRATSFSVEGYERSGISRWAHLVVPPLWLAKGANELRREEWAGVVACAAGLWLAGALGLQRSYRATMRFYTSEEKATARSAPTPAPTSPSGPSEKLPSGPLKPLWIERRLPGVRDDTAGVALISLRSMLRAPEMKLALVGPIIMVFVFGALFLKRNNFAMPVNVKTFMPTGLIALMSFGFLQLLLNQFGLDRHAFRGLALLPTPRRSLLLGKNLAFAPFYFIPGLVILTLVSVVGDVPPLASLSAVFQMIAMYCVLCAIGNLFSLVAPFRINAGSLKPTKQAPKTVFLLLAAHLVFPLLALPIFLPVVASVLLSELTSAPGGLLNLALSMMVAGLCWLGYTASLGPLSDLFERREMEMLRVLTEEVE